jgi:hypothetical protein
MTEQQSQLHMHIEAGDKGEAQEQEGHQLLNMAFTQGKALPNNRAYLDGYSTVTAFKSKKYLEGIQTLKNRIKINCNAGAVTTNQMGSYGRMNVWYIPKEITNIFLMHELEKMYRITYDSLNGYYIMHTPRGK